MRQFDRRRLVAIGLVAAGLTVAWADDPPAPAKPAAAPTFDKLWDDLQSFDDETATRAVLALSRRPAELIARAKAECQPLAVEPDEVRAKIKLLGDKDEAVWKPAFEWLEYYDPRLAIGLKELMDEVTAAPARQRLVTVLSGRAMTSADTLGVADVKLREVGEGFNFMANNGSWWAEPKVERLNTSGWGNTKRKWTRLTRLVALLEHIGTPEAAAVIKQVATGHPDAGPTKAARAAFLRTAKK